MPDRRLQTIHARLTTTAVLIAATATTLFVLVWAMFPSAAHADGTINWTGNGSENLPCEFGAHWVFTTGGNDTVTSATLHAGGSYTMNQSGSGSWSADSGPFSGGSASVSYTGDLGSGEAGLRLSHCLPGPSTTTSATTTTGTTTTGTTTTLTTTSGTTTTETLTTATTTTQTTPSSTTTSGTTTTPTTAPTTSGATTTPTTGTSTTGTTTDPATTTTGTSTSATVGPTTVEPTGTASVAPTTVSVRGTTAFTGPQDVVALAGIVLVLMTLGSGLLWFGSRLRSTGDEP